MPHKGRKLEEIVAHLNTILHPDAIIRSPDRVREIDIGIHYQNAGDSNELFIAVECRDRNRKGDVEWIEQLTSKKDSIGADVLIGVAATSFTKNAKIKAQKRGILLRSYHEFSAEEVNNLLQVTYLQVGLLQSEVVTGRFFLSDGRIILLEHLPPHTPIWLDDKNKLVTLVELYALLTPVNLILEHSESVVIGQPMIFECKKMDIFNTSLLISRSKKISINHADILFKITRRKGRFPPLSASEYVDVINKNESVEKLIYGINSVFDVNVIIKRSNGLSDVTIFLKQLYERVPYVIDFVAVCFREEEMVQSLTLNYE